MESQLLEATDFLLYLTVMNTFLYLMLLLNNETMQVDFPVINKVNIRKSPLNLPAVTCQTTIRCVAVVLDNIFANYYKMLRSNLTKNRASSQMAMFCETE
jgi:hypothetical protein